MAKSLLTIRTEVARRLTDTNLTRIWSATEVDDYINKGFYHYCLRTGILWKRDSTGMDDVAHQALYDLPTDAYLIERVSYKGYRIEPLSTSYARVLDPQYRTTEGQVVAWMQDGDGMRKLRKVRIPAGNGTAGDTQIEFRRRMAKLTGPASTTELPNYLDKYARFFALAKCYEREGEGQNLDAADHYMLRFEMGVDMAIGRENRQRGKRITIIGGREGERPTKPPRPVLPSNFPRD